MTYASRTAQKKSPVVAKRGSPDRARVFGTPHLVQQRQSIRAFALPDALPPEKALSGAAAMAELSRRMSRLNPTFAPCLPRPAKDAPAGPGWIHEIKHDGFRILARRDREHVRLFTRHGTDFTARYPKIAAALASLSVRSCALDGEAIVVNADGLSVFDRFAIGITITPPCSAHSI